MKSSVLFKGVRALVLVPWTPCLSAEGIHDTKIKDLTPLRGLWHARARQVALGGLLLIATLVGLTTAPVHGHHGVGILFDLGGGARATGMGGAFLAVSDDHSALLHNPAGLARLADWAVLSSYSGQFGAAHHGAVHLAGPWAGAGLVMLGSGEIRPGLSYLTTGGAAAVALPVTQRFAVGARGRMQQTVSPASANGWAFDLAVLWRGPIAVGILWEGIWSRDLVQPGGYRELWPRRLGLGVAVPLPLPEPLRGTVAADLTDIGNGPPRPKLGTELWIGDIGLRAGVGSYALSFGASLRWRDLQLDWATILHHALGNSFRGTLTLRF